ncbi:LacI family DNA-binding transcriptional regulator [Brachybacterium sp. AOP43-C2-M15]|uniref:LacI family DNA-binding transcriptional regulator n=1 Tax=Brachybacterium sp. AOP43-C2-M15 TaxID=3457661 RepID=UPI0040337FD7
MAQRSGPPGSPEAAPRRPTIRDVAEHAGVSKSLVSLAFRAPEQVGAERRERILTSADVRGFRPNRVARSLNGPGEDFVGILVADSRNPVFADVVDAARAVLQDAGRLALLTTATTPDPDGGAVADLAAVEMLGDLRPSGIIIVGSVPDMDVVASRVGTARLVVASAYPGSLRGVATVRGDDLEGMRSVVEHLVERGHRRIAHVGGEGGPVGAGRAEAFVAAMRERFLDETLLAPSDFTQEGGERAAERLLSGSRPPTAITATNDLAAIGVMRAVRRHGLADRVAVTGYDGTFLSHLGPIDLTSVDPGNARIGQEAARMLVGTAAPGEVLVPPTLSVRSSSAWSRSP